MMKEIRLPWQKIGAVRPRSVGEIGHSPFTLGCEVLDRGFADYDEYCGEIVPLGIPTIRLQGGWARTEQIPGRYDFAWLDHIIDDALSRGLNILLETDYGNPAYPGGGGADLAGSFPCSPVALAAWDRWVAAMAHRYAGKVRDWAMWNEPDYGGKKSVGEIVDFNIRTARIIRGIIPDARIAGLSLASSDDRFVQYVALLAERGELENFTWLIYHGYTPNPDCATDTGERLRTFITDYSDTVRLRQGENGCPSERTELFSLNGIDWSEFSQSKWDLRRFIGDVAHGVETSIFTICDFYHVGREVNRKGLLYAGPDHKVVRRKQSYYAIQHMTSIFDDRLRPVPADRAAVTFPRRCAVYPFSDTTGRGNLLAFWDRSDVPGEKEETENVRIMLRDLPLSCPVLVEMISGSVYRIPEEQITEGSGFTLFRDMPIIDSPLLLADRSLLCLK